MRTRHPFITRAPRRRTPRARPSPSEILSRGARRVLRFSPHMCPGGERRAHGHHLRCTVHTVHLVAHVPRRRTPRPRPSRHGMLSSGAQRALRFSSRMCPGGEHRAHGHHLRGTVRTVRVLAHVPRRRTPRPRPSRRAVLSFGAPCVLRFSSRMCPGGEHRASGPSHPGGGHVYHAPSPSCAPEENTAPAAPPQQEAAEEGSRVQRASSRMCPGGEHRIDSPPHREVHSFSAPSGACASEENTPPTTSLLYCIPPPVRPGGEQRTLRGACATECAEPPWVRHTQSRMHLRGKHVDRGTQSGPPITLKYLSIVVLHGRIIVHNYATM